MNEDFKDSKLKMIANLRALGISNEHILNTMYEAPRHIFVSKELESVAYEDVPLPIGFDQTLSQPYIVAFMLEAANIKSTDEVLEIGVGSGYNAFIISRLAKTLVSLEVVESLAYNAMGLLAKLGCNNVKVEVKDGNLVYKKGKKFDVIIVTAAPVEVPAALVSQLKIGGRLITPQGEVGNQKLKRIIKTKDGIVEEEFFDVGFVPMTNTIVKMNRC